MFKAAVGRISLFICFGLLQLSYRIQCLFSDKKTNKLAVVPICSLILIYVGHISAKNERKKPTVPHLCRPTLD